jgi:glycosyltransferase involved in cell wall biosynthesis
LGSTSRGGRLRTALRKGGTGGPVTVFPVRIRYVVFNAYAIGGTTRTVVNQANALCADHDVEIASVYRHRETPAFRIDPRVRVVPLTELRSDGSRRRSDPVGESSRLLSGFRRLPTPLPHRRDWRMRRWDPEVDLSLIRYLHAGDDGVLVTTRPGLNLLAARVAPRRLVRVAQDHMNMASYPPGLRRAIVRAYRTFDAVVVLTPQDQADYGRALDGAGVRVQCIPNGVPESQLPPAALDAKVLVAAGRLVAQKGFDMLLDAFALVAAKHPDWALWIFGGGDQRDALAAQVDRLGLQGRAHLKRTTRRLDRQMAAASIYVLSSRSEGYPMVLLEAMTAGLPAVAFDCPTGPAEMLSHGTSGLLVPPGDVPALAAGICELIEDEDKRRAMGAAALEASRRYSIMAVRPLWERLFEELTAAREVGAARPRRRAAAGS